MKWQTPIGFLLISNIIINHWCEDQNLFLKRWAFHTFGRRHELNNLHHQTDKNRHSRSRPEEGSDCENLGFLQLNRELNTPLYIYTQLGCGFVFTYKHIKILV